MMNWSVVVVVVGFLSATEAFFFNFKGGGGGGSGGRPVGGKYPGTNNIPTHYGGGSSGGGQGIFGKGRPSGGQRPGGGGGGYRPGGPNGRPVRPVTTYGPPVRPTLTSRPSITYGPPSINTGSGHTGGKGNGGGNHSGGKGGKYPSSGNGGKYPSSGNGGKYPNGKGTSIVGSGSAWGSGGHSSGWASGGTAGNGGSSGKGTGGGYTSGANGGSSGQWGGKGTYVVNGNGANTGGKGSYVVNGNGVTTGGHSTGTGGKGSHGSSHGGHGSGAGAGKGGAQNHHTHFHSHYHTSVAGSWSTLSPQIQPTITSDIIPRTATFTQRVSAALASVGSYLPVRGSDQATQGQASDKVATFIRPEQAPIQLNSLTAGSSKEVKSPRLFSSATEQPPTVPTARTPTPPPKTPIPSTPSPVRPRPARALTDALASLKLGKFLALVNRAGIQDVFNAKGGFTVFAFTDEAWLMLPFNTRAQLATDGEKLRAFLLHHVTPVVIRRRDFNNNMLVKSASSNGSLLRINIYQMTRSSPRVVTVNGAVVEGSDDTASNGIVHVIDKALIQEANLNALQFIGSEQCADLDFQGVSNMLSNLGITDVLAQETPLTLFLPISSAFSNPSSVTRDFANNTIIMQNSLMYHIVPGTYYSAGLRDGQWLKTLLDGQEVQVQMVSDGYSRRISTVSKQAQVIEGDIPITNGVVHIIDFVLRPERNLQQCRLR